MNFDDITVYVILSITVLGIIHIYRKLSAESFLASATKNFLLICVAMTTASALLFWRTRSLENTLTAFDAWVTAIDIAFAHTVVVPPLFLGLLYLFNLVGKGLFWLLAIVFYALFRLLDTIPESPKPTQQMESAWIEKVDDAFLSLWFVSQVAISILAQVTRWVLPVAGTIWVTIFILKNVPQFQEHIFGAFDSSLGWISPTSYRFTAISQRMKLILAIVTQNEVVTTIASSLAAMFGILLTIGGVAKAISNIGEAFSSGRISGGFPPHPKSRMK